MFKLIILVLGLVIGFGGGVWWGQKNPDAAGKLSAQEESRFLQAQLAITQKIQGKLDTLENKTSSPGSSLLGNSSTASSDVSDLKAQTQKQEAAIKKRIDALK